MVTREQAEALADEWIAAWNAHDLPRVLTHYTDDFEMQYRNHQGKLAVEVLELGPGGKVARAAAHYA